MKVPEEIQRVRIRAHDSVHGFGGKEVVVELRGGGARTGREKSKNTRIRVVPIDADAIDRSQPDGAIRR